MLHSMAAGLFQLLTPSVFAHMLLGVLIGMSVGFIPGLGGNFVLAVLLPFVFGMQPTTALALLLGAHAVVLSGGSISAILFGTPPQGPNAAVLFDGYAMTRKGEGARAVGASLTAAALGGILGACVLGLLVPLMEPIVLAFGPPEFFMLTLVGICLIASVAGREVWKGLVSGGFGLLLSLVGQEPSTATLRYTFGSLYLWNGVPLVPTVIGLFALAEMLELGARGGAIAETGSPDAFTTFDGVRDVLRHWALGLRSALLGTVIGMVPGLGGEVANFVAYGQAVQTCRRPEEFGSGRVEGVIAPEAANHAKEGGALVPTLAFGIPGSSSMAILLGALLILGLQPGPQMLTEHADVVFLLIFTIVIANVIASTMGLFLLRLAVRATFVRGSLLVPIIYAAALTGAYAYRGRFEDVVVAAAAGVFGLLLKRSGYPRATLTIGLVLGAITEKNLLLSLHLFGYGFLTRPLTILLGMVVLTTLAAAVVRGTRQKTPAAAAAGEGPHELPVHGRY